MKQAALQLPIPQYWYRICLLQVSKKYYDHEPLSCGKSKLCMGVIVLNLAKYTI